MKKLNIKNRGREEEDHQPQSKHSNPQGWEEDDAEVQKADIISMIFESFTKELQILKGSLSELQLRVTLTAYIKVMELYMLKESLSQRRAYFDQLSNARGT